MHMIYMYLYKRYVGDPDICICYIAPVQNPVPPHWHLPRRASWHCVGWLLDGHWILKRNYAVYAAPHLAFASARLMALRRLLAGRALDFEEELCSIYI